MININMLDNTLFSEQDVAKYCLVQALHVVFVIEIGQILDKHFWTRRYWYIRCRLLSIAGFLGGV